MAQQPIFQSSLQDLIKGIRANRVDSSSFISKEIADIKLELRCTDPFMKAEAVRKLTYLQMLGYNVSWASFAIVEVMSQPRFGHKRIGYLAANQTFDENTEVILLTTNLFKKEFGGSMNATQYEIGLAINSLANIATKDLARDCMSDLVLLMNHTRPYIRKKAVLCMYKLFVKFPQGLRLTFDKLKDRLDDSESSVVSTAVNVICELANKNPRNYLAMAPKFFKLLTTSSNNWMLIKVVKLLGSLVSEEPRLARKLLEPLATIIQNTGAKSLQYECIYTVTEALPYSTREDGTEAKNAPAVIKLCSDYLRGFIEDHDQNLKYLGLVGLIKLMKSSPRSAVDHRDIVLQCLNDDDVTIRTKALEVLAGIVSRKSLVDLVHHLMKHARLAEGAYRDEVIAKILFMCRKEKYSLVSDFAWYTSVLLELAVLPGSRHGAEVADQLIEVALRVATVRPYAVESMLRMLLDEQLVLGQARATVGEVLKAAAWIVGEYAEIVTKISRDRADSLDADDSGAEDDDDIYWIEGANGDDVRSAWHGQRVHLLVAEALLHPRITNLPQPVQKVYLQAALKIFVRASEDCDQGDLADIVAVVRQRLDVFLQSPDLEVQERATTFRHILSELDILPLNWEQSTEEISRETPGAAAVTAHSNGGGADGLDAKERELMDLLEMPMYTRSSVRAVDEHGAKQAVDKSAVLRTLTAEEFYAVHSKAQRRVPVPEELNLDAPLNSKALDKLLATEIPENLNLSAVMLVQAYQPSFNAYASGSRGAQGGESSAFGSANDLRGAGSAAAEANTSDLSSRLGDHSTVASGYTTKVSDDVFMLGSHPKSNADIIPLSKILGDNFEDVSSHARGGKTRHKKAPKRRGGEVNVVEMVPAGAVSSDEEDGAGGRKGRRGKSGGGKHGHSKRDTREKQRGDADEDEVDLGGVDITTPLRPDEVFHVPTHRVVSDQRAPHGHGDGHASKEDRHRGEESGEKRKSKKKSKDKEKDKGKEKDRGKDREREADRRSSGKDHGKDKSKDKEKESKREKKHSKHSAEDSHRRKTKHSSSHKQPEEPLLLVDELTIGGSCMGSGASSSANLLGFDSHYGSSTGQYSDFPSRSAPNASPAPSTGDRIAAMFDAADKDRREPRSSQQPHPAEAAPASSSKSKSEKSKKSSSGHFWMAAHSDSSLDVLYSVATAAGDMRRVQVQWKVVNHSPDGSAASVQVLLDSPLLSANPCNGGFVALASNLPSGGDAQSTMTLGLYNPVDDAVMVPCRLAIAAESLIGPETRSFTTELSISVCASFSAYKLSEDAFAQALGSLGSKSGGATAQLRISGKTKSAFKALAGFLHAHIVESESSKAASMAARTPAGEAVYVLAKASGSSGSRVQCDIKCACATRQESERLAQLVAAAVSGLPL